MVTYHPILPTFQSIIKRHPSTLHISEWLREAFPLPPLIVFRRMKNLRNFLVRATLTVNNQEPPDNPPCGAAGWKMCPILMALDEFTSHTTSLVYKLNFSASCNFSNIIYLITCRRCGQQYVGEIGQPLQHRIDGHRFNMTHGKTEESPMVEHFNGERHTFPDMTIVAMDKIDSHHSCLRKIRGSRWIRTLGPHILWEWTWGCMDSPWNLFHDHQWPQGFAVPPLDN